MAVFHRIAKSRGLEGTLIGHLVYPAQSRVNIGAQGVVQVGPANIPGWQLHNPMLTVLMAEHLVRGLEQRFMQVHDVQSYQCSYQPGLYLSTHTKLKH